MKKALKLALFLGILAVAGGFFYAERFRETGHHRRHAARRDLRSHLGTALGKSSRDRSASVPRPDQHAEDHTVGREGGYRAWREMAIDSRPEARSTRDLTAVSRAFARASVPVYSINALAVSRTSVQVMFPPFPSDRPPGSFEPGYHSQASS